MIKLNIHEAKTHLSRYLKRLLKGETIILCRRNVPIAEIRPLRKERRQARPVELAEREYGRFEIPRDFFEPLPEDMLDLFEGSSS